MASSKAPSNDFAPAWLKIPTQPSAKGTSSSNEKHSGRHVDNSYRGIQRQRSFDYRYDDSRPNSHKYRHHSLDGYYDDYYYGYYDDYYGYQAYPAYPPFRRGNKYHHPNARPPHDPFYYAYGYPYDFADPPYFTNTRPHHTKEGLKNQRNDKQRRNSRDSFNSEFPSLGNGTSSDTTGPPGKTTSVSGVWDKPNNKVLCHQGSVSPPAESSSQQESKEPVKPSTNIYKAVVSSKGLSARKPPVEDGDNTLFDEGKSNAPNASKVDLSTDSNSNQVNGCHGNEGAIEDMLNGVNGLHLNSSPTHHRRDDVFLSSSLEAEQRLLREMGWNETDEEEYEITEDDLREFQNLSKQLKEQCNGQMKHAQLRWPGKDFVLVPPMEDELNQLGHESSDESDLDSD